MTNRPIVVGYDGSAGARGALRWAVDEARRLRAPLRVVHAFEWPLQVTPVPAGVVGYPEELLRAEAGSLVRSAAESATAEDPDLVVEAEVVAGPTSAALLAESARARLVVLGSRGRGGFTGLLLGSVGVNVTGHAHCPVVVVRGTPPAGPADAAASPVVVGVDGSASSALAAGYAFEAAACRNVGVVAARAWLLPHPPYRTDVHPLRFDVEELEQAERQLLAETLAPWRDKYPQVPVDTRVVADSPAHALISLSHGAALVVVGTRGHGGFTGLLLGSVSQQLLHHAHCPVAVVREVPE